VLQYVLDHLDKLHHPDATVLEFGVFRGFTLRRIARAFPDRIVYGFDAFQVRA
jgi:hypothetical protein